ncbi:MAG: endonuclease III, partial [Candidatus Omnitrophota bacterium]
MDKKARAGTIIRLLKKEYPAAKTALKYWTPVQMLVATILSAQCTDKRVN